MKTLEELATDVAAITQVLPKVILDEVERVARAKRFGRNLVRISEQLVRTKGRSIVIPRAGSARAVSVGEGASASKAGIGITGNTISPSKIGYTAQITQEALDGADFDLIRLNIEEAGIALADKEDRDVVNELLGMTQGSETVTVTAAAGDTVTLTGSQLLNNEGTVIVSVIWTGNTLDVATIGTIDFYDGKFVAPVAMTNPIVTFNYSSRTASRVIDATSAGSLAYEDLLSGASLIRSKKWTPNFLLINPSQMAEILKDNRFIDASRYGDREALINGEVGKISGMKVLVTTQIDDGQAIYVDSTRAAWLALKRPVDLKRWDNPTTDSVELYFFMEYGVSVTDEEALSLSLNHHSSLAADL